MRHSTKSVLFIPLMGFMTSLYAGVMGEPTHFSGFYGGAGGSYIYTSVSGTTHISQSTSPTSIASYDLSTALTNHIAPIVNAGYFYNLQNQWYLGAKGYYKYIGIDVLDQTWNTTYPQTGSSQTAALYSKLVQDASLLFVGAYQFNNWLLYSGVGPGIGNTTLTLNGATLPIGATNAQQSKLLSSTVAWGGAGQVGIQYLMPNRFSVDLSYNFLATSPTGLPNINFISNPSTQFSTFSQQINVVEQGFNITLNKYFG